MSGTDEKVELTRHGDVALIVLKNPPVNALAFALRDGVMRALAEVAGDASVHVVVLAGSERAFSAGADISEFGTPPRAPTLRDLIAADPEGFPQAGHRRDSRHRVRRRAGNRAGLPCACRRKDARIGQPEFKLGLLPGAGGTQRLPRLAGVTGGAGDMHCSAITVPAERASRPASSTR